MYMRVVRFTDVSPERIEQLVERINQAGGPPPGVNAESVEVLVDQSQRTAVVLQRFATEPDMREAAKVFDAMDPAETPGTRTSVDVCERKLQLGG